MVRMEATKYEVTIKMEVASLGVISSLLSDIQGILCSEFAEGSITTIDGDSVRWDVKPTRVES